MLVPLDFTHGTPKNEKDMIFFYILINENKFLSYFVFIFDKYIDMDV